VAKATWKKIRGARSFVRENNTKKDYSGRDMRTRGEMIGGGEKRGLSLVLKEAAS